jgi:hypothetical protein
LKQQKATATLVFLLKNFGCLGKNPIVGPQ